MAEKAVAESNDVNAEPISEGKAKPTSAPRKIPGNLPYLNAPGTLKKALDGLTEASQPPKFNGDFLENVLKLKGGSARAVIPILKRVGLLTADGVPTDLYSKFRTESGRGKAAYDALKNGFPEIFKRSEYAHSVPDAKLRDIIMEITGLQSSDQVAVAIKGTFNVLKAYVPNNLDITSDSSDQISGSTDEPQGALTPNSLDSNRIGNGDGIRLSYNINIVLPETSDLKVLNAIFRSIKENLMQ